MFRNPRENATRTAATQLLPSTGRSPTPPSDGPLVATLHNNTVTPKMNSSPSSALPVLGRTPLSNIRPKKNPAKQNQSILNFFGKSGKKDDAVAAGRDELFFAHVTSPEKPAVAATRPEPHKEIWKNDDDDLGDDRLRFNEENTPQKRRRLLSEEPLDGMIFTPSPKKHSTVDDVAELSNDKAQILKQRGGFLDESEDEEEDEAAARFDVQGALTESIREHDDIIEDDEEMTGDKEERVILTSETTTIPLKPPDESHTRGADQQLTDTVPARPTLSRQGTSAMFAAGEFGDEDFDDEFFPEGEEFLERRYMEEQLAMERAFEDDSRSESGTDGVGTPATPNEIADLAELGQAVATCPMCSGSLRGLTEAEASSHVNACLDGTAEPLPTSAPDPVPDVKNESSPSSQPNGSKRFQRAAIARPAQANPFSLNSKGAPPKSAFTRLMSGHAEDAAWAEAASNEAQSRGKPAYQRTCPFYKIMPGLFICVDAFRYGKVEGQNAYFLSHFHSDHYIGLTSQWCHGPIYASKVTCNLMVQQLRVNPKWIVPLEFEKKVEVPNTKGVFVTMIPANHCPGSSLYLFEKIIGKNKDGSPRMNRVLHCGDFRACPAHIHHPLLKPTVLDAVTGINRHQTIDTCYLDTTYLTPKYSFPSQYDVIDACAQMCVSLSKEIVDSGDKWEKVKTERAGSTMKKFLEAGAGEGEGVAIKKEAEEAEEDVKPKRRGRLLVVIGTYSIGKERICLGIARALDCKIFAPPSKMRICRALEDAELNERLTSDPLEAQVHMQMLMEIRAETLHDYLVGFKPHFSRVVGFRPTGWSYRPPTSRFTENPAVNTVLHSEGWKSRFTMHDLAPQRGSTKESNCFGVPYSEHSSFRELTMFCCALRIGRVIPTVNVGSARSREKMKGWIEKWDAEKRKNGLFEVDEGKEGWGSGDGRLSYGV